VSIARAKELIVVGLKVTRASRHDLWAKDPTSSRDVLVRWPGSAVDIQRATSD
jgi:hypothetical protein